MWHNAHINTQTAPSAKDITVFTHSVNHPIYHIHQALYWIFVYWSPHETIFKWLSLFDMVHYPGRRRNYKTVICGGHKQINMVSTLMLWYSNDDSLVLRSLKSLLVVNHQDKSLFAPQTVCVCCLRPIAATEMVQTWILFTSLQLLSTGKPVLAASSDFCSWLTRLKDWYGFSLVSICLMVGCIVHSELFLCSAQLHKCVIWVTLCLPLRSDHHR